jgi:hypothetical protein
MSPEQPGEGTKIAALLTENFSEDVWLQCRPDTDYIEIFKLEPSRCVSLKYSRVRSVKTQLINCQIMTIIMTL